MPKFERDGDHFPRLFVVFLHKEENGVSVRLKKGVVAE